MSDKLSCTIIADDKSKLQEIQTHFVECNEPDISFAELTNSYDISFLTIADDMPKKKIDILIVEDDLRDICKMLKSLAENCEVFDKVFVVFSREVMLQLIGRKVFSPKVISLDFDLEDRANKSGSVFIRTLELYEQLKSKWPSSIVLAMSEWAYSSRAKVLLDEFHKNGDDVFPKNNCIGVYGHIIRNFISKADIVANANLAHAIAQERRDSFEKSRIKKEIIIESEKWRQVIEKAKKAASTDYNVLITGENGTGKELVAQTVHEFSKRKNGPFVAVNCGAIPENLIESEIFGHVKGAFTGAIETSMGRAEMAHKGTLFLDEIGEIPMVLQVKLLRFLQNKKFSKVGGNKDIEVDIRIISATNRDLEYEISQNNFRKDLFFRLKVIPIHCPPLRERPEDILVLAKYFLTKYSEEMGKTVKGFSKEALDRLMHNSWPGNVRELENAIIYALTMGESNEITPDSLDEFFQLCDTKDHESGNQDGEPAKSFFSRLSDNVKIIPFIPYDIAEEAVEYIYVRWVGKELPTHTPGEIANDQTFAAAVFLCFINHFWKRKQPKSETKKHYLKIFRESGKGADYPQANLRKQILNIIKPLHESDPFEFSYIQNTVAPDFFKWFRSCNKDFPDVFIREY